MMESFHAFRFGLWPLLAGLGLGAGLALLWGALALWAVALLAMLAVIAMRFVTLRRPQPPRAKGPEDPLSLLPPQTRTLFERLPLPVMLLDGGQRVLLANRDMRAALGQNLERRHVTGALRHPELLNAITRALESGEPASAAFSIAGDVERNYEAYAARIDGGLLAIFMHDVTAIRRSEQMRVDFVANASHELRTPLAAVSGFIETLRGHARDDEEARERFLGIMASEAARMRRLIDDLLSLTRIELNEHVRPDTPVTLEPVLRQAIAALVPLAAADRITVTLSGAAPEILGDRDALVQLFENLIHNAIKYGREGGQVTVTLGHENGYAIATVRDEGEGIPREALPRLTERFYRVDVKRSRERGGTGLGLAIVKHIVSRHDGRLVIESTVGEGSAFTVVIPQAPGRGAPKKTAESAVPAPVTEML